MNNRQTLMIASALLFSLLIAGRGYTLTCKTVSQTYDFPGGQSDSENCGVVIPQSLSCPKGYSLTGGRCNCQSGDGCSAITSSQPHDKGTDWLCGAIEFDDINTHICQATELTVYAVCCK